MVGVYMDAMKCYTAWCDRLKDDAEYTDELMQLSDAQILEGFSCELAFGTGGMRGIIGMGPNRLNDLTVSRITRAVGRYLQGTQLPQVVAIAYDTRKFSKRFAELAAQTLERMGIKAYVFKEATPTPVLSFAVDAMKAGLGIVITASHNPPQYNGYKVYDHRGVQINPDVAEKVTDYYNQEDIFDYKKEAVGQIHYMDDSILDQYVAKVEHLLCPNKERSINLSVVYTALHGTGSQPVSALLQKMGYQTTLIQQNPDSNFGGLASPNPESRDAYVEAIKEAKEKGADLILATDPDADRVGVLVVVGDDYRFLNGNQIAGILMHHLIKDGGKKQAVVTTVVSGELAQTIAKEHGIMVNTTLTGFKYIGDLAHKYQQGHDVAFLFGYEESYGYLTGDFVHDKDAVIAALLIAEVAAKYKADGKNLYDVWEELSHEYGWFVEELYTVNLPIVDCASRSKAIMGQLRGGNVDKVGDFTILSTEDYKMGTKTCQGQVTPLEGYPVSDVLKLHFDKHAWVAVRPSGTEPKIKLYFSAHADDEQNARATLAGIKEAFLRLLSDHI